MVRSPGCQEHHRVRLPRPELQANVGRQLRFLQRHVDVTRAEKRDWWRKKINCLSRDALHTESPYGMINVERAFRE